MSALSVTFIVAFFLLSSAKSNRVTLTTVYLDELCHSSHGSPKLRLESPSSINSTVVIKSHRPGHVYAYNIRCKLTILAQWYSFSNGIVASVRFTDFRENCTDSLSISDEKNSVKEVLCDLQSYKFEEKNFTSVGKMTIEFQTGTHIHGNARNYDGFQLTVTAFRNLRYCSVGEFPCKNRRCISRKLVCDGHNHCGDNSDQQCGSKTKRPHLTTKTDILTFEESEQNSTTIAEFEQNSTTTDSLTPEEFEQNVTLTEAVPFEENVTFTDAVPTEEDIRCLSPRHFLCENEKCVNYLDVCDGINDCGDWSDETYCDTNSSPLHNFLNQDYSVLLMVSAGIGTLVLLIIGFMAVQYYRKKRDEADARPLLGSANPGQRHSDSINQEPPRSYSENGKQLDARTGIGEPPHSFGGNNGQRHFYNENYYEPPPYVTTPAQPHSYSVNCGQPPSYREGIVNEPPCITHVPCAPEFVNPLHVPTVSTEKVT